MITIQLINTKDPLYSAEQNLRNQVLLRPIGLPDHAWEMHDENSWHFVALDGNRVIGCVVLLPLPGYQGQLMQMAVTPKHQKKGVGKLLVRELLRFSKENSIQQVVCHARDQAIGFYEGLGFEVYNDPFVEVGIPHRHMRISVH